MKLALIGYGKMGHEIERQALARGHEIVARVDVNSFSKINSDAFRSADVAIEFTTPATAYANCKEVMEMGIPVVCGTTGWLKQLDDLKKMCAAGNATLFYSSNFSVGMNIFMMVNRYLARIMRNFTQYHPSMDETHHIHKLDHPSGSAVTLANELIEERGDLKGWEAYMDIARASSDDVLHINCHRVGEVPGIHTIKWDSPADTISITHDAKSRAGFALGAVVAAEWVKNRTGFFEMKQLMESLLNGQ